MQNRAARTRRNENWIPHPTPQYFYPLTGRPSARPTLSAENGKTAELSPVFAARNAKTARCHERTEDHQAKAWSLNIDRERLARPLWRRPFCLPQTAIHGTPPT
jgi:hypothetical protein